MSRPAGVTISAVFLILGSLLTVVFGVVFLFARSFVPSTTPDPPFFKPIMVFMAVVLFCFAIWGLATALGLFRMRRWARICILVIGALLVFFFGISLVMIFFLPAFEPSLEFTGWAGMVMGTVIIIYFVPIAMGIWCLIYFNRAAAKTAFHAGASVSVEEGTRRPLSIAIIAWHAVVFGVMAIPFALFNWPAYIFGILLTGWAAKFTYLLFGVAQLAIGIGLLKLKPWGHTAAVWFCIFVIVHSVVFAFMSDKAAQFAEMMKYYPPEFRTETPMLPDSLFWFSAVFTWLPFGTVLWYLFTRKKAFLEAGKSLPTAA